MNKKKINHRTILILSLLFLVGCRPKKEIVQEQWGNKIEKEEKTAMAENNIEEFHKFMEEDKSGDKKSVLWDGTRASIIDDILDDKEIEDGRGGIYVNKMLHPEETWMAEIILPTEESETELISDTQQDYFIKGQEFQLRIEKVDFDTACQELQNEKTHKKIERALINEKTRNRFKRICLYRGMIDSKAARLAGYTFIVEGYTGSSYALQYYGTGNMAEVAVYASQLFNHFID